jgi:hypothetical protein
MRPLPAQMVTWREHRGCLTFRFLIIICRGPPLAQPPASARSRRYPDDHHAPATALGCAEPVFTGTEWLALAGYSGLTRVALSWLYASTPASSPAPVPG